MKIAPITQSQLSSYYSPREGETKIGDKIVCVSLDDLRQSKTKYAIIGLPEDVGVRANLGIGGAQTLWPSFLSSFLSMQSSFINGEKIALVGELQMDLESTQNMSVTELRTQVEKIDEVVFEALMQIYTAGKIPIIIGGGHNNSYPNLKSLTTAIGKKANCINIDAHHDYRVQEGRHSGNGFRYAMDNGFLDTYLMVGLHRYYMQETLYREMASHPQIKMMMYEDMLAQKREANIIQVMEALKEMNDGPLGLEIDMDVMAGVLSSAMTPTGLSPEDVRELLRVIAIAHRPSYIHICEGVTTRADGLVDKTTGKLAAHLVADFIFYTTKM